MTVLIILLVSILVLGGCGTFYSRFLARSWGEDKARITPAVRVNDGRDYVPTPTPIVFAHHFASIAGAGPIIGPVIALCYGWQPALLWVLVGGVLIGGVHDYLAAFMSTREGGQSVATVARRVMGNGPFLALMIFLVILLALVCATFLNLSATALTSMVSPLRLALSDTQTLFRQVGEGDARQVVIGGIASTSVIVITLIAPLIGWLYIKKNVRVWICSLLAIGVCVIGITAGIFWPVALPLGKVVGSLTGTDIWKLILAAYVLVAAGVPVWLFLQSRDFINVHILYVGLALLVAALVVGALRGTGVAPAEAIPAFDAAAGAKGLGPFWPAMFITIACGAVSGFHSLCAGGTTCKQLKSEVAVRRIGYWGMILESFLAVCVIGVLVLGSSNAHYLSDVHPKLLGLGTASNPILGFAMAVGNAGLLAFGVPIAIGALGGMILLEGFLVTTLDTAVRLMRYLLEEIWHVVFGMAAPVAPVVDEETGGSCGIPTTLNVKEDVEAAPRPPPSFLAKVFSHYWVNSGIAVALMLWFAFSSGILALWSLFATANQLLAAFVLLVGTLWLLRRKKGVWSALIPSAFMLVTTFASLLQLFKKYGAASTRNTLLWSADGVLLILSVYLAICWVLEVRRLLVQRRVGA